MTPTTKAGIAAWENIFQWYLDHGPGPVTVDQIVAIEAEAEHRGYLRANDCDHSPCIEHEEALLAELEAGVKAMAGPHAVYTKRNDTVYRAAVLDLIRKADGK